MEAYGYAAGRCRPGGAERFSKAAGETVFR